MALGPAESTAAKTAPSLAEQRAVTTPCLKVGPTAVRTVGQTALGSVESTAARDGPELGLAEGSGYGCEGGGLDGTDLD